MLNFPVGAGTSGHLLGGALAAVLVGPWTAVLCLSVVLLVQSLLFADGGVTALGTNVVLMGVVGVAGRLARLPRAPDGAAQDASALVAPLAAVAAYVSVPVTALAFVGLYAVGGTAPIPLDSLTTAMLGWHAVIGLGEAVITGLVVASIVAVRPDLVHGARRSWRAARRDPLARPARGGGGMRRRPDPGPARAGLLVALLLAGVVSFYASARARRPRSGSPRTRGCLDRAEHASADGPLADYAGAGVEDERLSGGLAGVTGAGVVLLVTGGLTYAVRRRGSSATRDHGTGGTHPATPSALTWAPDTATACTTTATRRSTGPAAPQDPGPARLRAGRGRDAGDPVAALRRLPGVLASA